MIRENDAMTFTKRLNYPVSEVTLDEYLTAVSLHEKSSKKTSLNDEQFAMLQQSYLKLKKQA